ncbi:MAG: uncharacterized protein KVP18_004557 [Porospora cf. gigantea A]|uniref:uncharacterized protein n=1 Tax=Porospora cf. gigantea A TaxID=2853593 RepID=UPI003559F4B7|nr:MAG: hypothetical protein KVP18_004557 [Porospora cf. gigantea A]
MSLGLSLLSYVAAPAPMKVHQQLDRSLRQPPAWDFAPLISVRPKDVSAYRASVDSLIALEYLVSLLCHQYLVPNSSPMTSDNLPPLALWRLTLFQIESLLRTYLPGGSKLETDTVPGVEETFRQAYKATTGVDAEQLPESLLSVLPEVVRLEKLDGRALIFVERLLVASLKLVYRCADADVPAYMSSSLVALLCNVVYIHPALIVLNRERLVSAVTSICSDVSSAFHKLTFADGRSTMRAPADVIQGLLLRCAPLELPTFRLSQQAMFSLPNHGHGSTEQFTLSVEHSLKLANSIDWASPGAARLLQAAISTVTAHLIGGLDDASAELAVLVVHSLQALSALAALTTSLPDPGCERMICLSVVAVAVAASRLSSEAYQHRAVSAVTACATHLISKASDLGDDIHLRSAILRTALLPALLNEAVSPLSEAFASEASLVWNGDAPPLERAWMAGDVSESIFLLLSQQSPLDSVRQRASIASVTFRMALCILDSCTKLLLSGEDQESWEPCIMSTLDCLVLVVDALVELIKDERVPGEHTEAFLEYLKNLLLVFSTSPLVCDFDDGLRGGHCSFEGQRLVVQAVEGLADRLQVTTASVSDPLSLVKEQPQAQQRTKLELSVRLLSIMSHLIGPSLSPVVLRDSVVLLLENTAQPPEPASPERGSEQRPPPPPEDPPANLSDEHFDDAPAFSNEPHADPSQPPPAGTHAGVAWPVIDGEPTDLPAETEVTDKNTK